MVLNVFFADPTAAVCLQAAGAAVYHIERDFSVGDIAGDADEPLPLRASLEAGEALRLWCGRRPEDICGLYMLLNCLHKWQTVEADVRLVTLPFWEERPGGVVVISRYWGEKVLAKAAWREYAATEMKLPPSFIIGCALLWRDLQRENAPQRALVDWHLLSVAEDFYDNL